MNLEKLYLELGKMEVFGKDKEKMEDILNILQLEIENNGKINTGIVKEFKKFQKDMKNRPKFKNVCEENGRYFLTNGYFLIYFGKNKENVPRELRNNIKKVESKILDTYIKNCENYTRSYTVNYDILKKVYKHNKFVQKTTKEKDLIDVKIECEPDKYQYNSENQFLYKDIKFLNPELIIQAITLSGNKKVLNDTLDVAFSDKEDSSSGLLFQFENARVLILPYNTQNKKVFDVEDRKYKDLINKE